MCSESDTCCFSRDQFYHSLNFGGKGSTARVRPGNKAICIKGVSTRRRRATLVQPVQRAKCWRLLNLEPRFEWYHVRARHNTLIYRPYKETANVFLVTASISPSVLAVWELHALSPPSAGRYALDAYDKPFTPCVHGDIKT